MDLAFHYQHLVVASLHIVAVAAVDNAAASLACIDVNVVGAYCTAVVAVVAYAGDHIAAAVACNAHVVDT